MGRVGAAREGEKILSGLLTISIEPHTVLELTNYKIVT